MKLVVEINEEKYKYIKGLNKEYTDYQTTLMLYDAIRNGTPLPKRHGDLIDRNSVDDFLLPKQDSDTKWCATGETIKQLIRDAFDKAPTIIEADRSEE